MGSPSPAATLPPSSGTLVATTTRSTTSLSAVSVHELSLDENVLRRRNRHRSVSVGSEDRSSSPDTESIEVDSGMSGINGSGNSGAGVYYTSYGKPQVPTYDGRDDVHAFVEKLDVYFEYSGVTDEKKRADILILQCQGEASQHLLAVNRNNINSTYTSLKESLVKRYGGQKHTWQSRLFSLRQGVGESVVSYATKFRSHLLRSNMTDDEMAVNLFITGLESLHCQYQVRQTESKTVDEAVRHAELWDESFGVRQPGPYAHYGAFMMAPRLDAYVPTPQYVMQQPYYMAPSPAGQAPRMAPYMVPGGGHIPVPPTSAAVQYPSQPTPAQASVLHVDVEQPLTSSMLKDMLSNIETRLNNQLIQHVQTVVNEAKPAQATTQSVPKPQQSQQQQGGQQGQGGRNSQQGNRNNGGNGGGNYKQNGRYNVQGGYNQQQQQQQYGAPAGYSQYYGGAQQPPQQQNLMYPYQPPGQTGWMNSYPQQMQQQVWEVCQLCGGQDHFATACYMLNNLVQQQRQSAPALPSQPPPQQRQAQSAPQQAVASATSSRPVQQGGTVVTSTNAVITHGVSTASVYAAVDHSSSGATPLYCQASVEGVETEDAVMDSGSGITLISGRLFSRLPDAVQCSIGSPSRSIQVKSANESPLTVKGEVFLDVVLGGEVPLQKHLPVLVIDGLAADVIVGNDQLQHFEGVSIKYNNIQYVHPHSGKVACLCHACM